MRTGNISMRKGYYLLLVVYLVSLIFVSSKGQATTNNTGFLLEILDNGSITLNGKGVSLKTLLGKIQEKTNTEFILLENLSERPIFNSFQSRPFDEAIRSIFRGVSYACLFDSKGKIEKVITFPNHSKSASGNLSSGNRDRYPSSKASNEIFSSYEKEDIKESMGIVPRSEMKDMEEAMEKNAPQQAEDESKPAKGDANKLPFGNVAAEETAGNKPQPQAEEKTQDPESEKINFSPQFKDDNYNNEDPHNAMGIVPSADMEDFEKRMQSITPRQA